MSAYANTDKFRKEILEAGEQTFLYTIAATHLPIAKTLVAEMISCRANLPRAIDEHHEANL